MNAHRVLARLAAWSLTALALATLAACTSPDAGLEVTVRWEPALLLDQLVLRLSTGDAEPAEVLAPETPDALDSGEETAGFLLPDALIDVPVAVLVIGRGQGDDVASGEGSVTTTRGAVVQLEIELAPLFSCGNAIVEVRESCDDDNASTGDGCDASCAIEPGYVCAGAPSVCARCGDGSVDVPESCDDGPAAAGDGCSASCAVEPGFTCAGAPSSCTPTCGDGLVRGGESCDDGGTDDGDGCGAACVVETGWGCNTAEPSGCAPICGDGLLRGGEACDDRDVNDDDGCAAACTLETGWLCDGAEPTACSSVCGDGLVRGPETCDDDLNLDGDGCSATCAEENGYACAGEPSSCVTDCGDGITAGAEACDDGAANSDTTPDACRTDCALPFCGDLVVDSGEGCDDGDLDDRDGCRTGCRLPSCGDGLILGGETCDDGDSTGGDGCDASCAVEGGFTCFGEPSVCAASALTHVVAPSGGQFTTLTAAHASGTVQDGHVLFVRAGVFSEEVSVTKDLTIVGEPGAILEGSANNVAALRVRSGAVVTLQGMTVRHNGNNDPAVSVEDAGTRATLVGCALGPSNDVGLLSAAGTTVVVQRTLVAGNAEGGLDLSGSPTVESSVLISNGTLASGGSALGGARLRTGAVFRFNTVVDNLAGTGIAGGVLCATATTVTSSIVFGNSNAEVSGTCAAGTSWVEGLSGATDPGFLGDGFHLGTASPVIDQAPFSGCPALDFDGQERPMGAGCEPGADERP